MSRNHDNSENQSRDSHQDQLTKRWEDRCSPMLVGKTIKSVRYQYTCEKKDMGWSKKALIIFFTDGSYIFPSSDDEGNDAGAYFTSINGLEGIPTI